MKAAMRSTYGDFSVLEVKDVPQPQPGDTELLIRVHAATANRTDCHVLWGRPLFMRLFTGISRPRRATTGSDFAGEVVSVGNKVTHFMAGDKVIGFNFFGSSSHAEYVAIGERHVCPMADGISYEQAAACIEGAFYALSTIRKLNPQRGDKVIIFGATGAIGSASVQILKYYQANITAVCPGLHSELVRLLGADRTLDYTTTDPAKETERFNMIVDAVGKYPFARYKHLLQPGGKYTSSSGAQNLILPLITPLLGGKKVVFAPPKDLNGSLEFIMKLAATGQFKPVIDRIYPLEEIGEAFAYVASGEKIGNVVVSMPVAAR